MRAELALSRMRLDLAAGTWDRTFRVLVQFAGASPAQEALARWGALEAAKTLCEMGRFGDALAQIDPAAQRPAPPPARRRSLTPAVPTVARHEVSPSPVLS